MIRWRATDDDVQPVAVECSKAGYPHHDAQGRQQHTNTHFDTEDEAWESCRRGAEAFVSLAASDLRTAEAHLEKARRHAAEATKHMDAYCKARDRRDRT